MKWFIFAVALALSVTGAYAQSDRELCSQVGVPAGDAAKQLRVFSQTLDMLEVLQSAAAKFEGEEKASMELLEVRRVEAATAMKAFTDQLEDTAYILQRCAR